MYFYCIVPKNNLNGQGLIGTCTVHHQSNMLERQQNMLERQQKAIMILKDIDYLHSPTNNIKSQRNKREEKHVLSL